MAAIPRQGGRINDSAEDVFGESFLTIRQVARIFQVQETTIRDWIARGEIAAVKFGKSFYVSESVLKESKATKEEEARKEAQERRAARRRAEELRSRRALEPAMSWDIATCIVCGLHQLLTTHNMRLDGHVVCESCTATVALAGYIEMKDTTERRMKLTVEESKKSDQKGTPLGESNQKGMPSDEPKSFKSLHDRIYGGNPPVVLRRMEAREER